VITKNPFLHITQFKVRACEINENQEITFPALVQLLQEASLENIINLKLSAWDDDRGSFAWVLLRKEIEVFRYPKLGEEITVETYPSGFEKIFAFRDYRMFDLEKNLLASASSTWTYMNLKTRRIAKIPKKFLKFDASAENETLPRPRNKISPLVDISAKVEMRIRKYHLDWNGHVNNNHYFKFLLEVIEPPIPGKGPSLVVIHIKNECLLGEQIEVVADQSLQSSIVSILKGQGKVVAHALVQW